MIRRAALLGVLFGFGLQATLWGDIINVPGDQPTIQAAIDAAADGDEIIVAPGTYFENINLLGKAVTLRSSAGPEVTTIDANGSGTVVTCDSGEGPNTVLQGFTISGGVGSEFEIFPGDVRIVGGGMLNSFSSPMVSDCAFSGNEAVLGGGMFNYNSNPEVTNCAFGDNTAVGFFFFGGGGMYNNTSHPTVTNCAFSDNTAVGFFFGDGGGGMYNVNDSSPTLTHCTFIGNSAGNKGGGMFNESSSPTVTHCTFSRNSSGGRGGGMANDSSSPAVSNCTFSGNSSGRQGGGMANGNSSLTVTNCTFSGNEANFDAGGSGMWNGGSSLTVSNCKFTGNRRAYLGGGMWNQGSSLTVINSTFTANEVSSGGAGMYNSDNSSLTVINCILWGDTPDEILDLDKTETTVSYSNVQGGWPGDSNIDLDPLFVEAGFWDDNGTPGIPDDDFWVEGDDHLLPGSPCIDAGDNAAVPDGVTTDLDGNPRFVDGDEDGIVVVDMGAYEFGPPDPCADEDGDGQVTICHIPPGNPDNAHTITVGVNAVPAHLAHGDHCGPCGEDGGLLNVGNSAPTPNPCPADLNSHGIVGAEDLAQLLGSWGPCTGCPADLNGDSIVGAPDLAILLGAWGPCAP